MATPNYWIGNVDPIPHIFTIVFATAATGGGSVTVTVGYKSISVSYLTGNTAAAVAAAVYAALSNSTVPEFAEYDYSYDANVTITATHKESGVQAALAAATTGGTGTTVTVTTTQQATGPNWISAAGNWSLGLPTNAHDAIIGDGPAILYGLNAPGFASDPASVRFLASYTNPVGLDDFHESAAGGSYFEFRKRHWEIGSPLVVIGEGVGDGSPNVRIGIPDAGTLRVLGTGRATVSGDSAVNVTPKAGATPALFTISGGSVAFGVDPLSPVGTTLAALVVNGDAASFVGGRNQTITAATINRGIARMLSNVGTLTAKGGVYRQEGGSVGTVVGSGTAQVVLAHEQNTDIAAQLTGLGSTAPYLDCSENSLHRQLGNTSFFKGGAYLIDPAGTTALTAVLFDSASAKASQMGDSYTVTR